MDREWLECICVGALAGRRASDLLRRRQTTVAADAVHIERGGRPLINFASNDYLGLTHHPKILRAMHEAIERSGGGAGASALISGYGRAQEEAEAEIAAWKGTEGAVLLPSGYQAAHAAVQTLAQLGGEAGAGGVRFLMDRLVHASLIDGVRGTGAEMRVFPHNHLGKLERLLSSAPPNQLQVVVTESVFSMDGDAADLQGLAELKRRHRFVLLLDEAHGSGVYGPGGAGYAAECGQNDVADVSIATLSKALGVMGGAVCGSKAMCETVVNFGRSYIYSTAISPVLAGGICAAIGVLRAEPRRQERVRRLARRVREALALPCREVTKQSAASEPGYASVGDCPIIPLVLGEAERAQAAQKAIEERGYLVVAVRPPTVPPGTSRLRITVSCEHTDEEVEGLIEAVAATMGM